MDKLLLTPEEAAEALSIGRSKLYQLLAAGALRSVTIGSSRRVPVEALRSFVEEIDRRCGSGTTVEFGSLPSGDAANSAQLTPLVDADRLAAGRRTA